MTTVTISVDPAQLADVEVLLSGIERGADRALSMALNRVVPLVKTGMSRAVREQVLLPAAYVGQQIDMVKARVTRLQASLSTPKKGIPLTQYMVRSVLEHGGGTGKASKFRPGRTKQSGRISQVPYVRVKAGGPIKRVQGAFVMQDRRGQTRIAVPQEPDLIKHWGRPIKFLSGPSLSQVLAESKTGQSIIDESAAKASERLVIELDQAARYLILQQTEKLNPDG